MSKRRKRHHKWKDKNGPRPVQGYNEYGQYVGDNAKLPSQQGASYSTTAWHGKCYARHWQEPVELAPGISVFASARFDRPTVQAQIDKNPRIEFDIGFYCDELWGGDLVLTTPGVTLPFINRTEVAATVIWPWADHAAPSRPMQLIEAAKWLLQQATEGKKIEIGCLGAHGRTGTTVALLLILTGMSAREAITWIREKYCYDAIESVAQEEFLYMAANEIHDTYEQRVSAGSFVGHGSEDTYGRRSAEDAYNDELNGPIAFDGDAYKKAYSRWWEENSDNPAVADEILAMWDSDDAPEYSTIVQDHERMQRDADFMCIEAPCPNYYNCSEAGECMKLVIKKDLESYQAEHPDMAELLAVNEYTDAPERRYD